MSNGIIPYLSKAVSTLAGRKSFSGMSDTGNWTSLTGGRDSGSVGQSSQNDFNVQIKQFKGYVFDCTSLTAQKSAAVPLKLYVRRPGGNDEEVTDHRFLDMWRTVNPVHNHFDMTELLITYLCLVGNSYIWLNNDSLSVPAEMWILPAHRMKIEKGKADEDMVKGYTLRKSSGKEQFFPAEEIIHFRLPNPFDPYYYGLSLVWAAAEAIDARNNINRVERSLMQNKGRPDIGVVLDSIPTNLDEFEKFKKKFTNDFCSPDKQGRPLFLAGVKDIKDWSFPVRDFSFLKGRTKTKEDVYSTWKIPITYGSREHTPARATMDADKVRLAEDCVGPQLIRVQEKLNEQLLPRFDEKLYCKFDISSIVPSDKEYRLKERSENIKSGYSTPDEERAKDGEGPRPDGMGDKVLVSVNTIPADELSSFDNTPEGKSLDVGKVISEATEEATKIITSRTLSGLKGKAKKQKVYSIPAEKIMKETAPQVGTMRREVKKVYKDLGNEAAEILGNL